MTDGALRDAAGVDGDGDGALVVRRALVAEVVALDPEQERMEAWVMRRIEGGAALSGLYPPDATMRARQATDRSRE